MKKITVWLIAFLLLFSLTACDGKNKDVLSENSSADIETEKVSVLSLDDVDALSKRIMGINIDDLSNRLGEPQGWIRGGNCYAYLDSDGNGVFIYYDQDRMVCKIKKINYATVKLKGAETKTEKMTVLMNKLIGKSQAEMHELYGEVDAMFSGFWGGIYRDIDGVEVSVYYHGVNGCVNSITIE